MKTLLFIIIATTSFTSFANTNKCEIFYSSDEQYKMRWMDGSQEELTDVTLEECITRAQSMLGSQQRWKTLIRNDIRVLTQARYKFQSEALNANGRMGLPGQQF